ncbi:YwaF family protein [Paenibacillus sp. strain BS8-2]
MFEMFSASHLAALAVMLAAMTAVVVNRRKLRERQAGRRFRTILAAVLIACETTLQLSYVLDNDWGISSLPFQLCSMTLLIAAVMLLHASKPLYPVIVFLGVLGAMQAMITPNLSEPFPEFRYFHFFIAHIGIMMAALYCITVERYRPTLRDTILALIWLHVLAIPAAITNVLTGSTNFMFLARKPASASLLDALAPWPWYLLQLELVAVVLCFMMYGIIHLVHWTYRRQSK